MKILLLGSGGREHALARAMVAGTDHDLYCAPGNPGTMALGKNVELNPNDPAAVAKWASERDVDMVVIGPEAPLVAGVADAVRDAGIPVFGPNQDAAMLEGSKAFAKEIMAAAGVETARCFPCRSEQEAHAALEQMKPPYVVKNDGLAAGKGVVVTTDLEVARAHATTCVTAPGGAVVIEDYLDGPEVSLFCVTDGETVVPLAPAQDFKRALDNDEGPNTGGMGAYSPLPWLPEGFVEEVVQNVAQPVIDEMRRRGTPFAGLLYCGLAVTSRGISVIEFNARFGDPETQVVLPRLKTPLADLLYAAATGTLADFEPLQWRDEASVGVVMAAENYPATPVLGDRIDGITDAEAVEDVHVYFAGAKENADGKLETSGGRVLLVNALGADLDQARERAYEGVSKIAFRNGHYRTDIAAKAGQIQIPTA
ncbi:MAG: phosphoribosylamine--glycine ligase [Actinomycetaceae bacterium]|nr:phosphoribosylamine--glycine ligase [Actinomycetaceae bacterium]